MIGDSLTSDMAGAAKSGLKTCYFNKRMSKKADGLTADYTIDSLDDIRKIL